MIERFYYTVQNKSAAADEESVSEVEYLVIGRKIPWMEAKALCPSYDDDSSSQQMIHPEDVIELDNTIQGGGKDSNTTLATFGNEEERNWLARMLSESNYREMKLMRYRYRDLTLWFVVTTIFVCLI